MITVKNEVGSVGALHRYPVKSMMGEEMNALWVGAKGITGDRLFALSDVETGKVASAKNPTKWPTMFAYRATYTESWITGDTVPPVRITLPDGDTVSTQDENVNDVLSQRLGRSVKVLKSAPATSTAEEFALEMEELPKRDQITDFNLPQETFFDCALVHLITTSTLDELRRLYPEGRIEPRRFRPNIIVSTPGVTGFVEKEWVGKILTIGNEVRLKVEMQCPRCIMTTLAQGDLPRDVGVLKTAAKHNQGHVGIYASVISGGKVCRQDTVSVE